MTARLCGLSAHVIRIWEQRYRAVEPQRTPGNRRLYSPGDIERLNLLREATRVGHSISQIAGLPTERLRSLAAAGGGSLVPVVAAGAAESFPAGWYVEQCLAATRALDGEGLERALKRGATELGAVGMLQHVVAPLAQMLGERWRDGTFTAAHEHFASGAIRVFLGNLAQPFGPLDHAPLLVVATPAGQVHELGALLVAAMATQLGWRVTYLGASLPAAEIAGAVRQRQARAVALSLVYPEDDPRLAGELATLRGLLPRDVAVIAGGRAMAAYREPLAQLGATMIGDLAQLGAALDALRQPGNSASANRVRV
jgi:DNA-binding transcriptional MerR regulator/methylmalonyl-CoA mutase cobalamin-binding subunit